MYEKHTVWNPVYKMGFKSAVKKYPPTLKRKCKNVYYLNHAIGNIYYNSRLMNIIDSGIVDFVRNCKNILNARKISDHIPVFLEVTIK